MYCLREYQEQRKVIREAAMCYVALCQCGSKGQQGINYKEVWSSNFEILINTCHKLTDTNYSNIDFVSVSNDFVISFLLSLALFSRAVLSILILTSTVGVRIEHG